jgi:peptidyl-prolyl cis-trans isomerase C
MSFSAPVIDEAQPAVEKRGLRNIFPKLKRWLSEPLVQFLLIGGVLFGCYSFFNHPSNRVESSKRIDLTMDDIRQLEVAFAARWQRPPTQEEFSGLVEDKIREEVLYREALELGLDKEDTIVKRRMAQKMEFLAEDVSNAHEPTTQELKTWFENHQKDFTMPGRITFRHLYFSPDRRGQHAREDAERALNLINGKPADWSGSKNLADPFMFQDYYGDRSSDQLAKEFGPNFARAVFQLKLRSWQGPIESGYGWHLLWIDSITPSHVPQFEEVEPDVKTAWMAAKRAEYWDKSYAKMRKKYDVYLPKPPDNPQPPAKQAQ